ncbi:MAG: hypothetical protein R2813_10265 [Flavobacteriales bacterium]
MKKLLASLFLLISVSASAQSFREQFTEANLLTEDGYFGLSIPIWISLLTEQPDNANLNYKLGRCYLDLGMERDRALPFLKNAAKDVRKIYDPFASDFKGAPVETYFYLGKAEHIATNLDSAEHYYQKFLDDASKKHYLRPDAEAGLRMCATARKLMADPVEAQIINIGSPINSPYAEYSPIVAFDENTLYFTSRRMRTDASNQGKTEASTGMFYEDMYVSFRSINGNWMEPELLNINVADEHSSVVSMSPDGRKLYIYKTYNGDGNIYESDFVLGTGWSQPGLVGSNVNTTDNEFFATITSDEQRLYFVSDRKGGEGGKDIWYCQKLPNGEWGKAINAGKPINTAGDENAPYLHPDGKTMYFSSNGHESMGGYDVFVTRKDQNGNWTQPSNLGYPINSTDDDHSYVSTPSGTRAYYSSNKGVETMGSTDIYVIEYKSEEEEAADVDLSTFAVLKGYVFPAPNEKLPDNIDISITERESNALIGVAKPVERNGSFVFIIPSGREYTVTLKLGEATMYQENIDIPVGSKYQELQREIFLTPTDGDRQRIIALSDEVLGNVARWKLSFFGNKESIPIGSRVLYLDGKGEVLDTAYVSKDGYFMFKTLKTDQNYVLKPLVEGADNSKLNIVLDDKTKTLVPINMIVTGNVFYEEGKAPKDVTMPQQALTKVESKYYIRTESGKPLAAGSVIKFIQKNGDVAFTEVVNEDGSFVFHKLKGDLDFELQLDMAKDPHERVWIEETRNGASIRIIDLHNIDEAVYSSMERVGKAPVTEERTVYFVRLESMMPIPPKASIRFIAEDGSVLFTELVKGDGSFVFHRLSDDRDYGLELVAEIDPTEKVWIEEVYGERQIRVIELQNIRAGVFSNKTSTPVKCEDIQYFLKTESGIKIPTGTAIRFLDANGKVLFTELTKGDQSFVFHKLKNDDYTIELFTELKIDGEIWIEESKGSSVLRKIPLTMTSRGLYSNKVREKAQTSTSVSSDNAFIFTMPYNVSQTFDPQRMREAVMAAQERLSKNDKLGAAFEASASRVPTGFEGGNEALAKARLDNGKSAFFAACKSAGIDINKISTTEQKFDVNGPSYQPSEKSKEVTYSDYQYFKIILN